MTMTMKAEADRWAKLTEGAVHVGVTVRTIRRWIEAGRLPTRRTSPSKRGGQLRVRLADLDRLLAGEV